MGGIELNQVSVTFPAGGRPALDNINLTIPRGQCVLLTGECGCGKSTLLRLLNGIIPHVIPGAIAGEVRVNTTTPAQAKLHEMGRQVGTVYQNPRRQFFCADPLAELAFGSENAGQPPGEILARASKIAAELGIDHLLTRNMFTLSGGELQRIAIGAALMDQPTFLLLDEPASNLDLLSIDALSQILQSLRGTGITIIIAEHRLWFLREVVDRVVRLQQGRIIEDVPARQFWQRDNFQRIQQGLRALTTPQTACLTAPPAGRDGIVYQHSSHGNLYFPRGCVTVLSGVNGAGKSTLAAKLVGLQKTREAITLDGKPYPQRQRLRYGFWVMQDVHRQLFAASVRQELQMGAYTICAKRKASVVDDMALNDLLDQHPMALSGGQQQRVAVALALLAQREVVIFDEPTSGLDYAGMMLVALRLRQLARTGAAVILVTHDEEFSGMCGDWRVELGG